MFKIIASPNDYTSTIKVEEKTLSKTKSTYMQFWQELKKYGDKRNTFLRLRKARPQMWYGISIGRSKFSISLVASITKRRIGCEIFLGGVHAKTAFRLLKEQKTDIEQNTGTLDWQELPEGTGCRIVKYKQDVDVADESHWPQAQEWLLGEAELFHKTFSNRIKALPSFEEYEEEYETNQVS